MIENEKVKIKSKEGELSVLKASIKERESIKQDEVEHKVKSRTRGSYFCDFCKKVFKRKDRLDRHIFSHTGIVSIFSEATKMITMINRACHFSFQKQFRCTVKGCVKEYSNDFHLRRHIRISHGPEATSIEIVICSFPGCNQEFTNASNMKRHYTVKHVATSTPTYTCFSCNMSFHRKYLLNKHLKLSHNIGEFKFECNQCTKGFFHLPAFKKHLVTHIKKSELRQCPNCDLNFTKWSDLVKHRREEHKTVIASNFYCDNCPRSFGWKKSLRFHMKVHQKHEKSSFSCTHENCTSVYTTQSNLNAHIRSRHEGKKFVCEICSMEFCTKSRYTFHVNRHILPADDLHDGFKYYCRQCEKGFLVQTAYMDHLKTHNNKFKLRECANCPLTFTSWNDLKKHRRETHNAIIVGLFYCDYCQRSFKWKKSLLFHIKTHLTNVADVFQCPHKDCTKIYTTMSNLKAHFRAAHEDKKFLCTICNLTFSTKQRYTQHVERHNDPTTEIKESCLSLLVGLKVRVKTVEDFIHAPGIIDVPTESEISD